MENRDSLILNAVGDFILHGLNQTNEDPFEFVHDELKKGDLLFGNNEAVITNRTEPFYQKAVNLRTPIESARYIEKAGFDVLHLANNHIFDFGISGLKNTCQELDSRGIAYIGVGNNPDQASSPVILKCKGIRIGFLGAGNSSGKETEKGEEAYAFHYESEEVFKRIEQLRNQVDILIFSTHWDNELINLPNPKIQVLARKFIDAGADLILGHHSHIPHGIEHYKHGIIVYSLGNFQFKHYLRPEADYSFIFSIALSKSGLGKYTIIPLMIQQDSRPKPAKGEDADKILTFISKVSEPLARGITVEEFEDAACEPFFKDNMASWARRVDNYGESHWMQCFEWLGRPEIAHRFWVLAKKKNWSLHELIDSLDIRGNQLF